MFWNRTAEVLTGHRADQVIGRTCYQVLQNRPQDGKTPVCMEGCPSIVLARCGRIAPVMNVHMLCASGERKEMTMTPLILPEVGAGSMMLVHLFHEMTDQARAKRVADGVRKVLSPSRHLGGPIDQQTTATADEAALLTAREVEVLRLVGSGLSIRDMARELVLSVSTVRIISTMPAQSWVWRRRWTRCLPPGVGGCSSTACRRIWLLQHVAWPTEPNPKDGTN